jgi:ribose 5-phosphate isomerase B
LQHDGSQTLIRNTELRRWIAPLDCAELIPTDIGKMYLWMLFLLYFNGSEVIITDLQGESCMRVVLGSDHAGFEMKQTILAHVRAMGHEVIDVGTDSSSPVDYPDFAEAVGMAIVNKEADRGILICGSGVGAVIVVNKIPGIRASVCHDCYSAHQGVEHDNMNVLVLGARIIAAGLAQDLVWMFLGAEFTAEERHLRRLDKLQKIESKFCKQSGSTEANSVANSKSG